MENTEVNYENVRNIPIKLFDGTIVEKKRTEVETKYVYSTTIRKEKKEICDDKIPNEGKNEESSDQMIPIKINFINKRSSSNKQDSQSKQNSTQNISLSSSIPSLSEVSRRPREPKSTSGLSSTQGRAKTLDEIQSDLEVKKRKTYLMLKSNIYLSGCTKEVCKAPPTNRVHFTNSFIKQE